MTDCGCGGSVHLRHDDLVIPQGTDYVRTWPVLDAVTGLPVDMTGWSAKAEARNQVGGTLRQTWVSGSPPAGDGLITLDNTAGVSLIWTPEMTNGWDWPQAVYDIVLTTVDGNVYRLTQGKMINDRRVTT